MDGRARVCSIDEVTLKLWYFLFLFYLVVDVVCELVFFGLEIETNNKKKQMTDKYHH